MLEAIRMISRNGSQERNHEINNNNKRHTNSLFQQTGHKTMLLDGYELEVIVYETVFSLFLLYGTFQILHVWRLPHNRDRVKDIQKWFGTAALGASFVGILIFIDPKCHFGIYDDWIFALYAMFLLWMVVPPLCFWLRFAYTAASIFAFGDVLFEISKSVIYIIGVVNILITSFIMGLAVALNSFRIILVLGFFVLLFALFEAGSLIAVWVILSKTKVATLRDKNAVENHRELRLKIANCFIITLTFMILLAICIYSGYQRGNVPIHNTCKVSVSYEDYPIVFKLFDLFLFLSMCSGIVIAYIMSYLPSSRASVDKKADVQLAEAKTPFLGQDS
jgi:hypothetical protein